MCTWHVHQCAHDMCINVHMPCASMCTYHVHQCAHAMYINVHMPCASMCTCHVHQCAYSMYINVHMPCTSMCTCHVHQCAHAMCINVHMPCASMCTCHVHQCAHAMYINVHMPCTSMCTCHVHQCAHTMPTEYAHYSYVQKYVCTLLKPVTKIALNCPSVSVGASEFTQVHTISGPNLFTYIHGMLTLVQYTERQPYSVRTSMCRPWNNACGMETWDNLLCTHHHLW